MSLSQVRAHCYACLGLSLELALCPRCGPEPTGVYIVHWQKLRDSMSDPNATGVNDTARPGLLENADVRTDPMFWFLFLNLCEWSFVFSCCPSVLLLFSTRTVFHPVRLRHLGRDVLGLLRKPVSDSTRSDALCAPPLFTVRPALWASYPSTDHSPWY